MSEFQQLVDLENIVLTQVGLDLISGADIRTYNAAQRQAMSKIIAPSNAIPFNSMYAFMGEQTLITAPVFTVDSTNKTAGCVTVRRLLGDGNIAHQPDFSNFEKLEGSLDFDVNDLNVIIFWFDGQTHWYKITRGVSETIITPSAPTNFIVDDTANTGAYTLAVGWPLSEHEQTLDAGAIWAAATNPISVGNVSKAINTVGVRVKAAPGRNASTILYNQTAYTGVTGGNRRTYAGYLERWEVPTNPDDTSKILTRVSGPDKFIIRLKGDKHVLASAYDLRQIDADSLQPKFILSGIDGRPCMEILATNKIETGPFPGAEGFDFPCEIGMICMFTAYPPGTRYFAMSASSGALFDMAIQSDGRILLYAGGASFLDTGYNAPLNVALSLVRRRLADGTTSFWANDVLKVNAVHGNALSIAIIRLGENSGTTTAQVRIAESWVSGSDNGGAPVLPTDLERTANYNDAKTQFASLT
jgi:hypothetical protein